MTTLLTQNTSESTIMFTLLRSYTEAYIPCRFLERRHGFVYRPDLVCEYVRTYFSVRYMQSQTGYRHRHQSSRAQHELIECLK